jgi:hypothetical protein
MSRSCSTNTSIQSLVDRDRAKALLADVLAGKAKPQPDGLSSGVAGLGTGVPPIVTMAGSSSSSKSWWEMRVDASGTIEMPDGVIRDFGLAYCRRQEYTQGQFKASDLFTIAKALPPGVSLLPNSLLDYLILSGAIANYPRLENHPDDAFFCGDYLVYPAGAPVGQHVLMSELDAWDKVHKFKFIVPDVPHPTVSGKSMRDATEMLVFRLSKLDFEASRAIVRVTQDFDPKKDVIALNSFYRVNDLSPVASNGYPTSLSRSDHPIDMLRYVGANSDYKGGPTHGFVGRTTKTQNMTSLQFPDKRIFLLGFSSWLCVPVYSTVGDADVRLDPNLNLKELK